MLNWINIADWHHVPDVQCHVYQIYAFWYMLAKVHDTSTYMHICKCFAVCTRIFLSFPLRAQISSVLTVATAS